MSLLTLLDTPTRQQVEDVWDELHHVYGDEPAGLRPTF
jgi:hypothetical protein